MTTQEAIAFADKIQYNELQDLEKQLGPGLQIGRILQFAIADGYALYIITDIKPRTVSVKHLKLGDAWQAYDIVSPQGTVSRRMAEENIRRKDALAELFG